MERSLLYMCVLLVVVTVVAAKNRGAGGRNKKDCGDWTFGECLPKRGSCGPGKKTGTRSGESCRLTERQFRCVVPCPGEEGPADLAGIARGRDGRRKNKAVPCRYIRGSWGECDTSKQQKTRTLSLKKGDETCEQTKVETKSCKSAEACKYTRGTWNECNPETKQRTRTLTLKRGNNESCPQTKEETKPCKANAGCKYGPSVNSTWTPCVDSVMSITLYLKKGDAGECDATQTRNKRCNGRPRREVSSKKCKYSRGEWGECNADTNMRSRTNTLKKGPSHCEATQAETRKCKKACRYDKGEWTECDAATNKRTRADTLREGSDPTCDNTRSLERKCNGGRQQRRQRCEFEKWGPYRECNNGVRTRMRKVLSGGEECQRRAVKTKPCRQ